MKTQQQADIELALALIGDDWLDQDAFDAAARAHKPPSSGPVYGYSGGDFIPPINRGPGNRHVWGAQLAMHKGLVETRRRKGLVEYRRVRQRIVRSAKNHLGQKLPKGWRQLGHDTDGKFLGIEPYCYNCRFDWYASYCDCGKAHPLAHKCAESAPDTTYSDPQNAVEGETKQGGSL